ncbi:hypothetical protein JCM4814A_75140 [Streptomyces phaeofaciens JCM 4814]|uniref:Uncharacterized protein n=1 Tax=Streptomyces phaeofaciens TaxID=68254 RepID=A0A918HIB0_9ACTN|nr:hypothetical protein [Streptomyces phaeofaciens]GGT64338.1 hypothetical protein GCM10010226_47590 [Streptomyces phaeofaciens]
MRGHAIRAARKLTLLLATLALTFPVALATAQPAQAAAFVHWRSARLPLNGQITGASEQIAITGTIDVTVVTRANPGGGGTARIISSLGRTTGVGATTGARYLFVGADVDVVSWPPDPVTPLVVRPTFLQISPFFPPNPIVPPHPIDFVSVGALVTSDGEINDIFATINLIENPDNPS